MFKPDFKNIGVFLIQSTTIARIENYLSSQEYSHEAQVGHFANFLSKTSIFREKNRKELAKNYHKL